jgi:Carboxypeptidase regulatory-like domain
MVKPLFGGHLVTAQWFRSALQIATAVTLGFALVPSVSNAATPEGKLLGALTGSVRDSGGTPQMGAMVQLFNRYDRQVEKALTDSSGQFSFQALLPDIYSLRVTLTSFMPALKRNVAVQPGATSVLAINLASVLSSIELIYSSPNSGPLMSDDWKWVLRSSMSTRPVLRMVDISDPNSSSSSDRGSSAFFSDTRGMIQLSSGDGSPFADASNQADLGTTFALATSLFGSNEIQVTGNIGYGVETHVPATGFRTTFSRGDSGGPAVKLTMRQVGVSPRQSSMVLGSRAQTNAPALRTMSLTFIERTEVSDGIEFEYGTSLDSVTFLERLNYVSPFARVTYSLGQRGKVRIGYSSGAPPLELLDGSANPSTETETDLQRDVTALAVLPRVSIRDGQARVQRSQNMEIGYEVQIGSRTYNVSAYRETVGNAALTMSTPQGFYMQGDLLPELYSNSSVFNIGRYARQGYTATVTQQVGESYTVSVSAGRGGVLTTDSDQVLESGSAGEVRQLVRAAQRPWIRGRVSGIAPGARTRFSASYEWTSARSLTPGHAYLTQRLYPGTGLNVRLKQPLPAWDGLPGRLEASAEFRNMLAQGYLPLSLADGRRVVLTHSPRAVRGGVSFIF